MTLRDLEYIIAVAEHQHFSQAAVACDVSQPTLSGQIRKLEDELGIAIFERDGRRVRVTPAGESILVYARQAVDAAADLVRAAHAGRDPLHGPLRVGMIPTLAPYLLPHLLPSARRRFPAMPLTVVEEQTDRLIAKLTSGEIEAAIVATDHTSETITEVVLFDEPLYVALPAAHPLAKQDAIAAADLAGLPLLLLTDGHCLRDQALAVCANAAVNGADDLRASSLETLINLVDAGYGATILPELVLAGHRLEHERITTRPFAGARVTRRVRLAYRAHAPRRAAFTALAEAIRAGIPPALRGYSEA
jgi:LysR family hydrogen peroxide-inducible transcriptional activator